MFRYENPQRGRMRQVPTKLSTSPPTFRTKFHQFGVEHVGSSDFSSDVEVIAMAWQFLHHLGLSHLVQLKLNTLGDATTRLNYRSALTDFMLQHKNSLSLESQDRLTRGSVLRILDSKDPNDRALLASTSSTNQPCPRILSFLTPTAARRHSDIQAGLKALNIPFTVDPYLVRGLDYYCDAIFEFVLTPNTQLPSHLHSATSHSSHSPNTNGSIDGLAVLGGGRYDGLLERMCAEETSNSSEPTVGCVGWAAGVERLAMVILSSAPCTHVPPLPFSIPILVIPSRTHPLHSLMTFASEVLFKLRMNGIRSVLASDSCSKVEEQSVSKQLSKYLKRFDLVQKGKRVGFRSHVPTFCLFIGDDEYRDGSVTVKSLSNGTQTTVPLQDAIALLLVQHPDHPSTA